MNDLDPIIEGPELSHDCEEVLPICDWCDEPGHLTEVADEDPHVGYHDTLWVCEACIQRKGKR